MRVALPELSHWSLRGTALVGARHLARVIGDALRLLDGLKIPDVLGV